MIKYFLSNAPGSPHPVGSRIPHKRVSIIQIGTGRTDTAFLRFSKEEENTKILISQVQKCDHLNVQQCSGLKLTLKELTLLSEERGENQKKS